MASSWLPFNFNFNFYIPNLTPPLSIQRRFISFLLKRCLGHLLKPGQLDVGQIDAQIGNGFVEVKDLELDCDAINSLLDGQPLLLRSGTIAKVTARIPWPNPFSSTIVLSLSGLRLDLRISKPVDIPPMAKDVDELAESVASVAESFLHTELTDREEAQLRQSVHLEPGSSDDIPGSMNAFLNQDQEPPFRRVNDPEGVSIFAGLFESLLARFDFDASDTQISLIHDDVVIALRVSNIRYFTAETSNSDCNAEAKKSSIGGIRSIQIQGIKLSMQDNSSPPYPPSFPGHSQDTASEMSAPETSDSDLDDETQMMMSQSIVSLPPRPVFAPERRTSPSLSTISSASAASSLYKSAISTTESPFSPTNDDHPLPQPAVVEHTILVIKEPIMLQLTTPPVNGPESVSNVDDHSAKGDDKELELPWERMKLEVSVGIISVLLEAQHVRGLLSLANAFPTPPRDRPAGDSSRSKSSETSVINRIDLSLSLKGIVVLVLGDSTDVHQKEYNVSQFFERPLIPPRLACGYLRVHVEALNAVLRAEAFPDFDARLGSPASPNLEPPLLRKSTVSLSIMDFSIFAFHAFTVHQFSGVSNEKANSSSPILVTDRNLGGSYRAATIQSRAGIDKHFHPYSEENKQSTLPVIDVLDWSFDRNQVHGSSLRPWRTIALSHHHKTSGVLGAGFVSSVGITPPSFGAMRNPLAIDVPSSKTKSLPAVSAKVWLGKNASDSSIVIEIAPLHLFLDLRGARSVSQFLELTNSDAPPSKLPSPTSDWNRDISEDDDELPSPTTVGEERRRLEKIVLDDLDLDLDYRQSGDITPRRRASPFRSKAKGRKRAQKTGPRMDILVPLLRVEVRVPPPPSRQPRSGILVLDLHSARLSTNYPREEHHSPRFSASAKDNVGFEDWFNEMSDSRLVSFEMHRIIIAYAGLGQLKAETLFSLGALNDAESELAHGENEQNPLHPLILFRSGESPELAVPQAKPSTVFARIPSLHAVINKANLDGLQLWADDVSQWAERLTSSGISGNSTRAQGSRSNSLIGSRYFIQRAGSGSTESEMASTVEPVKAKSELVVKACLSEVFVRLAIPMRDDKQPVIHRFLDICASDLDALIEVKPEGKDETVVSFNVLDVNVKENSPADSHVIVASRSPSMERYRPAVLRLRFRSVSLPGITAKESKVRLVLSGLIINVWSSTDWISDLSAFLKSPPGVFEAVIPSERTQITANVLDCAFRLTPPVRPSALVFSIGDVAVSTELVGDSREMAINATVTELSILLDDNGRSASNNIISFPATDTEYWMKEGYALLAAVQGLVLHLRHDAKVDPAKTQVVLNGMLLNVHLSADSISGISAFVTDLQSLIPEKVDVTSAAQATAPRRPTDVSKPRSSTLLRSLDEQAFHRQPIVGPLPDMVNDDLPQNLEYLDASFGAAAGFRALDEDEEDDEFLPQDTGTDTQPTEDIIAKHGGETIKMLCSPIEVIEHFYDTLMPSTLDFATQHGEASVTVRAHNCDVHLLLYDGYDWERTRKSIQEEVKKVRRRLARIRQLLANGQSYDPNVDEVNSLLFNSVYVGLEQDAQDLEGEALMAAIDHELGADDSEVGSESSWQSFSPNRRVKSEAPKATSRPNRLERSRGPSIEFALRGMSIEFDQYFPGANLASRLLSTVRDLEILDHIKTSTWSTFLTELRSDSRGNIRETDSNMVRVELQMLQPFQGHLDQEARLKAKLLPLRLHVDQDALDFLKKFFSFKDGDAVPSPPPEDEIFFQHVEIFPVDIKLDYKPRRVDYRALKEGRTIELMNFFHFDGSEMTLRHITLKGITGWARMFDTLNDLWTPDVKANQLVDVISGVSPIRSVVNVGSGVADLVLLPIAQYKKDGRIIRGLQKGTTAFVKSTAMEAIKLGARLATGTQVVLEQAEGVLGAQFSGPVTAETLQSPAGSDVPENDENASDEDLYSRYAEQPTNVSEGIQSAYRTLSHNIKSAGQTILAVPMEVYERSGKEGPARAVIRAVPIAVLKPMIGASGAISKTLLGLHNTLDPQAQIDTEAKYKHR